MYLSFDNKKLKLIFHSAFSSLTPPFFIKISIVMLSLFFYSTRGLLFIQWYVSSISKDIADFYLHFRDGKNKILLEKILAYDTRFANVSSVELERIDFEQNVELCVLARNSDYTIVSMDNNQCTRMPQNFNSVMKKFKRRPNNVFKVFAMDKNHLGRNSIVHATSGAKTYFNFKFIALIAPILLSV